MKKGSDLVKPVAKPQTIAKSLAIGTPADGYYAIHTMRDTGGAAEDATDEEIIAGIKLLAENEGIFAETAGGVTVACAKKLVESGKISAGRERGPLHHRPRAQDGRSRGGALRRAPRHQAQPARVRGTRQRRTRPPGHGLTKAALTFTAPDPSNIHGYQHPHPHPVEETDRRAGSRPGRRLHGRRHSCTRSTPRFPGLKERICDDQGNIRRFVNVYLNDEDIRFLDEQATAVREGDEISIVPAIAGG